MTDQQEPHFTPPTLADLSQRATMLNLMAGRFKELAAVATTDFKAAALKQYEAEGVKSVTTKIGGEKVITWTVKEPKASGTVVVADRSALTDWVHVNHPEHAGWEATIIGAFETVLLGLAVFDKESGTVVHRDTGEVLPGLAWTPSPPPSSIAPSWTKDGREQVMEHLRTGAIAELMATALQLEQGEG
ncbi:hypothetical protein [Streptomyces sp. MJM8645]|uniref:hypothetical protein n=1 Tax=Streptomycetaceae TaxID=2062 RepID=UPI0007AF232E|nr:hypothetical protein [Streptomyces sp. MJM8645]